MEIQLSVHKWMLGEAGYLQSSAVYFLTVVPLHWPHWLFWLILSIPCRKSLPHRTGWKRLAHLCKMRQSHVPLLQFHFSAVQEGLIWTGSYLCKVVMFSWGRGAAIGALKLRNDRQVCSSSLSAFVSLYTELTFWKTTLFLFSTIACLQSKRLYFQEWLKQFIVILISDDILFNQYLTFSLFTRTIKFSSLTRWSLPLFS